MSQWLHRFAVDGVIRCALKKPSGFCVLFQIPLEVGYFISPRTTFSAYSDLMSKVCVADQNEGMNTLGARFGYVF